MGDTRERCKQFTENLIKVGCMGFSPIPPENIIIDPFETRDLAGRKPCVDYLWHFLNMVSEIEEESPFYLKDEEFSEKLSLNYVKRVRELLESDAEIDKTDLEEFHELLKNVMDWFTFYDTVRLKFSQVEKKQNEIVMRAIRKRKRE